MDACCTGLKRLFRASTLASMISLSACSSTHLIVDSERAYFDVSVDTFPSQALIYVNGEKLGITPLVARIESIQSHRQKIAALPLFEHQFQQEVVLEPGRIPNYININMDIPGKLKPDNDAEDIEESCLSALNQPPTLFFDSDKYLLSNEQIAMLETFTCQLAQLDHPHLSIFGIADQNGDNDYNYQLALKRAQSVLQAMVEIGYAADKLSIFSYGESIVHTSKLTPTQDAFNRKVYFEIHP